MYTEEGPAFSLFSAYFHLASLLAQRLWLRIERNIDTLLIDLHAFAESGCLVRMLDSDLAHSVYPNLGVRFLVAFWLSACVVALCVPPVEGRYVEL